jgi:hypothetical protein
VGDEDDYALWNGPETFTKDANGGYSAAIPDLYLINTDENTRTYFRWVVKDDPNRPYSGEHCAVTSSQSGFTTNEACLGNIQMLKLK